MKFHSIFQLAEKTSVAFYRKTSCISFLIRDGESTLDNRNILVSVCFPGGHRSSPPASELKTICNQVHFQKKESCNVISAV